MGIPNERSVIAYFSSDLSLPPSKWTNYPFHILKEQIMRDPK